jgi:hypothetical protein
MEIDSETMPSPPSTIKRETNIIAIDPVAQLIQLFRPIQFLQLTRPKILQLDIKGPLGPDKLYRKQRDIKPLKEQPKRARDQRDSQATFQP